MHIANINTLTVIYLMLYAFYWLFCPYTFACTTQENLQQVRMSHMVYFCLGVSFMNPVLSVLHTFNLHSIHLLSQH